MLRSYLPGLRAWLFLGFLLSTLAAQAQIPAKLWDLTLGGTAYEDLAVVRQTTDGGYIVGGLSTSPGSGNKTQPSRGFADYWVVKLDAAGTKQWDYTFGGSNTDQLLALEQTADGGYILGGWSLSVASGDKTQPNQGPTQTSDYWLIKLSANGTKQWDYTFGGTGLDYFSALQQTADGGYILGGSSTSGISGDKTQPNRGLPGAYPTADYWLVKLDANGLKQWDQVLGGQENEELTCLQQTTDGGFIVGGFSESGATGDKSEPNRGPLTPFRSADFWVVKLDAGGRKLWDRTLGGTDDDKLRSLQQTSDGGYIVGGLSFSDVSGEKSEPSRGQHDYWVVKLSAAGAPQWNRTLGGISADDLRSLRQTTDGGYALGGISYSGLSGDRTQPNRSPNGDYWLVQLDATGTKRWDLAYGGNNADALNSLRQTSDGGFILGGTSYSDVSGDKTHPVVGPNGSSDFWLVRLSGPPTVRILGDSLLCNGGQVLLTAAATPAATGYAWSTGATTPTITATQPGTYTVTASFGGGFTSTARYTVRDFAPTVAILGDSLLCPGRPLSLSAAAPSATRYLWSTGATTPTISPQQPGTYSLTAFFASGCSRLATLRVRAAEAVPAFTLGPDTTMCEGATLRLLAPAATVPGLSYRWSDGSTGTALLVREAGTYSLTVSGSCGTQTATRRVSTEACLTIPNIITPNGDTQNERFAITGLQGSGWALTIYSRWGRSVYSTSSYHNDWGQNAAPGTYYYLLRHAPTGRTYKGWLEVSR
ncbi:T9SS type B sorting domain-containing protein [Hymenobacter psychrotolerans]|uniref:Gliding motility-associated C-terminal domain-containing protein n=1 Tax=Hymenobacter psychrotolerans DSM 18569 TaxID=1121959 RepID=A0A1M6X8G5_9BACT|nr:gliding motility-associated C-terminal domain-containing protein [Hymenobacter psychrotolerans]SHL02302.1 gliding motility-associated C-terminal domain-containing protein [Hymenobacter psychrotolerans DSM 18569]